MPKWKRNGWKTTTGNVVNRIDLEDVPEHVSKDLTFHFAKEMMDVIKVAVPGLNLKSSRKNTRAKTKK